MKCNMDCLHCIYDDCIEDEPSESYAELKQIREEEREQKLEQEMNDPNTSFRRKKYLANREEARERDRAYYLQNRERIKKRNRAYQLAHAEQCREKNREYYQENREIILARQREQYWRKKNERG